MTITHFFSLLGGLALFLYGMKMMSDGLELAAGENLQKILEKLTSNPLLAVLVGALITALIQSSSATTVMVVGFVNAGLMTLTQAIGVIMGANIGTTITGLLIALDIGEIAPLFAFLGVLMVVFINNKKVNSFGTILAGVGILFIGMDLMSSSMVPLRESEMFVNFITTFNNPFVGIAAGAIFTAIIQSSSASIGILQTLAKNGLIGLHHSAYVLFGQNIGTCITAVLSSLGSSRDAKRVAVVHLLFNVVGTVLFVTLCLTTPFLDFFAQLFPMSTQAQIAQLHVTFNIVTTLVLFPFAKTLGQIAMRILPDKQEKTDDSLFVPHMKLGNTSITIFELTEALNKMLVLAKENIAYSFDSLHQDKAMNPSVEANEAKIDEVHHNIIKAIPAFNSLSMSIEDSRKMGILFNVNSDIERIGDHAMNLSQHADFLNKDKLKLDPEALKELQELQELVMTSLGLIGEIKEYNSPEIYNTLMELENKMDLRCEQGRKRQIELLKENKVDGELCVVFSEILTDIERVEDHIYNIAKHLYHAEKGL